MESSENIIENNSVANTEGSFYERPQVHVERIPVGEGVTIGIERVVNPAVGIGGAYGSWGDSIDNEGLPVLLEKVMGEPLASDEKFNLAELGFLHRHFSPSLSKPSIQGNSFLAQWSV